MTLTLANILTVSRLFLAPIFLVLILSDDATGVIASIVIFFVAALTDWLDGFSARAYGQVTEQGEFLDPLADKVLTTSAFVAFYILDIMPLWMVIVIVVRDFGVTAMRIASDQRGTPMKTSWHAKVKTFFQMVVIFYLLLLLLAAAAAPEEGESTLTFFWQAGQLLRTAATDLPLLALTVFTLWTAIEYVSSNRQLFRKRP